MSPQARLLLRAWIDAILSHARTQVADADRRGFIVTELALLEKDFAVRVTIDEALSLHNGEVVVIIEYCD